MYYFRHKCHLTLTKSYKNEYVRCMDMDDDWIYYSGIFGLFKIRKDGADETQFLNGRAQSIQVKDNWVYFVDDSKDYNIFRARTDGTDLELLYEGFAAGLMYDNNWLYFRNVDDNHRIYRMRTDGSDVHSVTSNGTFHYTVTKDYLYYLDDEINGMYKIRGDGTGLQKLSDSISYPAAVDGDWLYYTKGWQGYIGKINVNSGEGTQIGKDTASNLVVSGK
ncbi:MAG TPA: DUF5050 domain-containing protein [Clostridia bacterium]|nr:DUF5050 domain-containing protein [Clostridia bacterium]